MRNWGYFHPRKRTTQHCYLTFDLILTDALPHSGMRQLTVAILVALLGPSSHPRDRNRKLPSSQFGYDQSKSSDSLNTTRR